MSEITTFEISGAERKRLAALLATPGGAPAAIHTAAGNVELPAAAQAAIHRLLNELATGTPVHVVTEDAELTTQDAADILGISRTYVVRLIDEGKLPGHKVGTHRRLHAGDVLRYKARRDERLAGTAAVADADIAAGVPYR